MTAERRRHMTGFSLSGASKRSIEKLKATLTE